MGSIPADRHFPNSGCLHAYFFVKPRDIRIKFLRAGKVEAFTQRGLDTGTRLPTTTYLAMGAKSDTINGGPG